MTHLAKHDQPTSPDQPSSIDSLSESDVSVEQPGHRKSLVLTNFFSLGSAAVLKNLLSLLRSVWSRRVLGVSVIGQVSWSGSLVSYFSIAVNPGFWVIAKRDVARNPSTASYYVSLLFVLQFVLSIVALAAIYAITILVPYARSMAFLLLLQGLSLILLSFDLSWLSHANEDTVVLGVLSIATSAIAVASLPFFVTSPDAVYVYVIIPLLLQAVLNLFSVWYCAKRGYFQWSKLTVRFRGVRRFLSESAPIGLSQASTLVFYNSDSLLLGFLVGSEAVGFYSTAYSLMLIPTYLSYAMQNAFFPLLARSVYRHEEAEATSSAFLKYMTWLGAFLAAFGWSVGGNIVVLLYGDEYAFSALLFQWLSLNLFLIFVDAGYLQPLNAWNHQNLVLIATALAAVANLALNLLLIPAFGAWGALVATIFAELIVIGSTTFLRRNIVPLRLWNLLWQPVATGVTTAIVTRLLCVLIPWWAAVVPGMFLFATGLALADRNLLQKVVKRVF